MQILRYMCMYQKIRNLANYAYDLLLICRDGLPMTINSANIDENSIVVLHTL